MWPRNWGRGRPPVRRPTNGVRTRDAWRPMDAERIVQLALGVPDAIQPSRRREAAVLALAKLAGESLEFPREAGDLCRYAYEVIVAALDDGALDGWLAGWDYQATSILHLRKALLERDDLDRSTYGRVAHVADDGAAVVVKWCRDHPVLDAPGLASSSA